MRIFDTIQLLVDKGADVNTKNDTQADPDNGNTILHRIVGSPELIKYLVEKGADVNARTAGTGWTPLHQKAVFSSGTTTAQALIECGADVNAKDNSGKTPLDMARTDQMKALLQSYQATKPTSVSPPPAPAKSGGCMGVLAVVACSVIGIFALVSFNHGRAFLHSSRAEPVPYSALANGVGRDANSGSVVQSWPGEHFPQTRTGYLQKAGIQNWSYSSVRYALNEMYARHGYPFKDGPIRRHFQKFSWYRPEEGQTPKSIEAQFTPVERANQVMLAQTRTTLVQAGQAIK